MPAPSIPDDEPGRLAALARLSLVGTGAEERFDRITRTVATLLDVPIVMLDLVDARQQWAKSAVGAPQGMTVPRELSFCGHVVGEGAPIAVPDARTDARFRDNPAVRGEQHLRAYLATPVRGESGHVLGALCALDTRPRAWSTEQRRLLSDLSGWAEAEIERAAGMSRAVEQMKDEFLATVSHELRTPLTSVKGALSLALAGVMGEMADEVRSLLEVGLENTDRLVRLVNDIVDLERLLGGNLPLAPADTDALALVAAAVDLVRDRAAAADVTIEVDVPPAPLFVDIDRTVQVLGHLVANAVKYSPRLGTVTVTSTTSTEGVVFVVSDQGPGVPAAARQRIFERFAHADGSDRREQPGSGLGLPLARGLAEQQGGWLEVAPEPRHGASFRLTLPLPVRSKVVL